MYKIIAQAGNQAEIYLAIEGEMLRFETYEEAEQFLEQAQDEMSLPKSYQLTIVKE
ncbi:hypothetical protein [Virgibacillus sediminis]|uniref:Uncharacterized protein n=1 Tax=Virgibacillus sediminis TaxID=202260 RepID=A0ABV7A971_9BACI